MTTANAYEITPRRTLLAWGIHALTASGAVVGAVALLAVTDGEFQRAAILMLTALAIDSVDGSLARALRVDLVLPHVDGRRLDDMVDYYGANSALPGVNTANDVGNAAAFLCSPLGAAITGETLHVDMGYHAMGMAAEDVLGGD